MKSNTVYLSVSLDLSLGVNGESVNDILMKVDTLIGELNNYVKVSLKKDDDSEVCADVHNFTVDVDTIYDDEQDELVYKKEEPPQKLKAVQGIG